MKRLVSFASVSLVALVLAAAPDARAECRCSLAVAGDIVGALQPEIARADSLYARGDFEAALAIYARAYASVKEPSLLYAQAMVRMQLGATAEARALFTQYLAAGGALAYRARAEADLRDLGGPVVGAVAAVGAVGGAVGGTLGGVTGLGRRGIGGAAGGAVGTVAMAGGVAGGVAGGLAAEAKPPKVAHGAAVVLGVVAVAAIAAVGIHGIAAGVSDDISLDAKFDVGMGLSGAVVGITAIYLGGLTAATATAGSLRCVSRGKKTPLVAPMAVRGGGGLAAALTF